MQPYTKQEDAPEDEGHGFRNLFLFALACVGFTIWCVAMSACSAEKRITRIAAKHPGALARPCATFYPSTILKDSTRVQYLPGSTIYSYDTIVTRVDCDSVIKVPGASRVVYRSTPCPPSITRVDTVLRDRFRELERTDKLETANKARDLAREDAIRLKSGRNSWRLIALIFIAYSAIRIILRYWLKISLP